MTKYALHLPASMNGDEPLIRSLWDQAVREDGYEPLGRPTWRVVETSPAATGLLAEFGGPPSILYVEGDVSDPSVNG